MVKKNSPTIAAQTRNPANGAWVPVVIGLASVFFLKSSIAVQLIGYEICYYLLLPLLWMDLTLYALWGWFAGLKIKPQITTLLVGLAVSAGLLHIIGILVSGQGYWRLPWPFRWRCSWPDAAVKAPAERKGLGGPGTGWS